MEYKPLICPMCRKETEKFVKSHILPKALHLDQITESDDEHLLQISGEPGPTARSQSGEWDKIVCCQCEGLFGVWDQSAIDFARENKDRLPDPDLYNLAFQANVDYSHLKLFALATLWRAHHSQRRFSQLVNLGEQWEEKIRDALLASDAGSESDFAMFVTRFSNDLARKGTFNPYRTKFDDVNFASFYLHGGFCFFVKIDQRPCPTDLSRMVLKPGQPLAILLRDWSKGEMKALFQMMASHGKK